MDYSKPSDTQIEMKIQPNQLLHIYNQGNNKQPIFFQEKEYQVFLNKLTKLVKPTAEILCYCLMPNHFHLLIYSSEKSCNEFKLGSLQIQSLTNSFRKLQSSYAMYINKKYNRSGSLFRQKIKMKPLNNDNNYGRICFNYIHENPIRAGLVSKIEDWRYSSYQEYMGGYKLGICNRELASKLLDLDSLAIRKQ